MLDLDRLAKAGTAARSLAERLDAERLPRHIAVIMDGNGRWAKARHLPRVEGHRNGVEAVRDTVEACAQLGVGALSLYAFSTENWKRPRYEIRTLMTLLREYLAKELDTLVEHSIELRVIGRWRELEPAVVSGLERAIAATAGGRRMILNVALNYSGRSEIVEAARRLLADAQAGSLEPLDEAAFARRLYTAEVPDPDLLIRTSGELRISNFLLWQIAYTEIWVTPTLWPDFRREQLFEAILAFQGRVRRFGGVDEADTEPASAGADRGAGA